MMTQEWLDRLEALINDWGDWKHECGYGLGCGGPLQVEHAEKDLARERLDLHIHSMREELRMLKESRMALQKVRD